MQQHESDDRVGTQYIYKGGSIQKYVDAGTLFVLLLYYTHTHTVV